MNVEELLNETMGLLREAIMSQTTVISDIEKEVARLRTEVENSKDEISQTRQNALEIATIKAEIATIKDRQQSLTQGHKESSDKFQNLALAFAKKMGEVGVFIAIAFLLLQYFLKR